MSVFFLVFSPCSMFFIWASLRAHFFPRVYFLLVHYAAVVVDFVALLFSRSIRTRTFSMFGRKKRFFFSLSARGSCADEERTFFMHWFCARPFQLLDPLFNSRKNKSKFQLRTCYKQQPYHLHIIHVFTRLRKAIFISLDDRCCCCWEFCSPQWTRLIEWASSLEMSLPVFVCVCFAYS